MGRQLHVALISVWLLTLSSTEAAGPRALLIEARNLAYDANYRNDQAGLRSAIAMLLPLTKPAAGTTRGSKDGDTGEIRAHAHYYLSWTYSALGASQMAEKDIPGALESGRLAAEHARAGLTTRANDPELHAVLVNALTLVAILDRSQFKQAVTEASVARRRALELGPENPRIVLMDAGWIFNTPHEIADRREEGLARWQEALRLFEAEADATSADPIAPRWGYALAYGWMPDLYLRMTPPQREKARDAAETALRLRPDFWYVREQVLPRLRE